MSATESPRPSASQTALFGSRAARVALGVCVASLVLAAALAWVTDSRDLVRSVNADTFSRSALGHRALWDALRQQRAPVMISRWQTEARVQDASLLILLEPSMRGPTLPGQPSPRERLDAMLRASERTLIVLPRRRGLADGDGQWVSAVRSSDAASLREVMEALGLSGQLVWLRARPDTLSRGWTPQAPSLPEPRLIQRSPLEPLVSHEQGVLIGRMTHAPTGHQLYVLTDPDLLANHGLHRGQNAALALSLIEQARQGHQGAIIIDEILHGYEQPPSLGRQLLSAPLVFLTAQALLLLLASLWAGMARVWPRSGQQTASAAFDRGFALDHTASLLHRGGHGAMMLERYAWMVLAQVGRELHAPRELDGQALMMWLHQASQARQVHQVHLPTLMSRVERWGAGLARARPAQLMAAARDIYLWRRAIRDGY